MISVVLNGAQGKMGQVATKALLADPRFDLIAELTRQDDFVAILAEQQPDVAIDFTNASSVFANTKTIIETGVRPVIGSSGLTPDQVTELQQLAAAKKLGGIIAPNFCIGAILMMRFAEQAAQYYGHAEIIEYHHEKKQDSPSGTAVKVADMVANVRDNQRIADQEIYPGARGANVNNVPVHAVRLPGLLAHQEILFGSAGNLLTIRHDVFQREAYMPGLCLACEKVMQLDKLVYGLEAFI